jgi:hypothetical protein
MARGTAAFPVCKGTGKAPGRICGPCPRLTAHSITFSSSRTFPSQLFSSNKRIASLDTPSIVGLACFVPILRQVSHETRGLTALRKRLAALADVDYSPQTFVVGAAKTAVNIVVTVGADWLPVVGVCVPQPNSQWMSCPIER